MQEMQDTVVHIVSKSCQVWVTFRNMWECTPVRNYLIAVSVLNHSERRVSLRFICEYTRRNLTTAFSVQNHLVCWVTFWRRECTSTSRVFLCTKSFKRMDILKICMRVHSGEKTFSCHQCTKSFCVLGNLPNHSRVTLEWKFLVAVFFVEIIFTKMHTGEKSMWGLSVR